jgi:large subunit ribosomal protein L17
MRTFSGRKLGRPTGHRKALLRNLATSLFQYEKIQTTLPKAKELCRYAEQIITLAKREGFNAHRDVVKHVQQDQVRKKIFEVLVPRYQTRSGGYTQIIRAGQRTGDSAPMAVVRLLP